MVATIVVLGALLVLVSGLLLGTAIRLRLSRRRVARLEAEVDTLTALDGPTVRPRTLKAAERAVRTVVEAAITLRQQGVGGLVMSSIDDLSRWAIEDRSEIARLAAEDGTVSVFFSDIEGSTALNSALGDEAWMQQLIAHDAMVRLHVERRRGHIVKSQGDGFMVVFGEPADAVRAGLGIQRSLSEERGLLRRTPIKVRIGIHAGTVIARDGDFFGQTVALAARVGAEASSGEILVTDPVAETLADDGRFALREEREVVLKGIPGRRRLWSVERARWRA